MASAKPKILIIDIETRPLLSYHWRMFKENIGVDQVKEHDAILCFAAKWFGKPEVVAYSAWEHGEKEMLQAARDFLFEADAVVTKNGEKFDLPWLTREFLKFDIPLPPASTHIDLQKTIKSKLRFASNRLDYVTMYYDIGRKVQHEGFMLWRKVIDGNEVARRKMVSYCKGDVRLTDRLYKKIRPAITNHPHMGYASPRECPECGSTHVHVSKYRRTKTMRIQQLHCQACGYYYDGKKQRLV
jgi:DNA polymerase elongation subunit (family B)/predicted RNA-binding Zn-ribbon protein involved in translation (DUF1610 family)